MRSLGEAYPELRTGRGPYSSQVRRVDAATSCAPTRRPWQTDRDRRRGSSVIQSAPIGRALHAENGRQYTQFLRPRFKEDAMRRLPAPGLFILVGLIAMLPPGTAAATSGLLNIDARQRPLNESEEAIAINPTNQTNIVIVTNVGHREAGRR